MARILRSWHRFANFAGDEALGKGEVIVKLDEHFHGAMPSAARRQRRRDAKARAARAPEAQTTVVGVMEAKAITPQRNAEAEQFYIGEEVTSASTQTDAELETNEQRLLNLMHRLSRLEAALPSDDLDIEQHSDDDEEDDEECIQDIVGCDSEEDDSYEDDDVGESEQRIRLTPQEMEEIDFYNNLGRRRTAVATTTG